MKDIIVHSSDPITLLGGGAASTTDVEAAVSLAPICVAADSGADLARRAGVTLAALIGDFDSVDPDTLALTPPDRRFHIAEQDSTDFNKALRHTDAPVVIGVGFLGARLDHQLAALHVLAAYPARPCVLLGESEIVFLCPPEIAVDTRPGDVVSLFPLATVQGTSRGLQWEIDGLHFHPLSQTGTSNAATGPCQLRVDAPAMIVMLPRIQLAAVTRALACATPSARWPARAGRYTDPTQS